jgi:hypothetical protein
MHGTGDHVKENKPDSKDEMSHVVIHLWNLDLK